MNLLDGRVILITGGSRGLGRALALACAHEGAALSLCARDTTVLEAAAAEVRALGADVLAVGADLGDARDVERLAGLTLDRFGRVDILVNNASELGPTPLSHLADSPVPVLSRVLEVNVVGPVRLTQAIIGGMLLRRSGMVINVSSDAAVTGYPGWGAYGASKAALDAVTRSWAAEVEGTGVRLLAVDPGDMDTQMHRAALPDDDPATLARPDDVAAALVRLMTGDAPDAIRVEAAAF